MTTTDPRARASLEIDLCRAWTRLPRSIPLVTTDGHAVDVIHLGTWTHGFGPDFRDAIISIDNEPALTGSVEIHQRTKGWEEHGHHLDPRYNDVVLHVVGRDDRIETRRSDGKIVPTVVLNIQQTGEAPVGPDWSLVGGDVCAEDVARNSPDVLRDAIGNLGDLRMTTRAEVIESDLASMSADALLYREILTALGYRQNRETMRDLVQQLPWGVVAYDTTSSRSAALLLGVGGFLPLSDREIAHSGLRPEDARKVNMLWVGESAKWGLSTLPSSRWTLARIRPQNHPIRRLMQFTSLIEATDGRLSNELLAPVRAEIDPTMVLLELINRGETPSIGRDRVMTIATNVLIPFAFAQANLTRDSSLAESASNVWAAFKAGEANERTRAGLRQVAGDVRLTRLTERHMQGLVHLTTHLCEPRRCYECPIARIVLARAD